MDRIELFYVSDRVPRLTRSGEDISHIKVDSIVPNIITKVVGTRDKMSQQYLY